MWRHCLLSGIAVWLATVGPASAFIAYVSNEKSNTVTVIDTSSWTVTKTIKVGQRPRGIEFTRDGKFVMVAVGDDDTIQVIDAGTQKVVDSLPSGLMAMPSGSTPTWTSPMRTRFSRSMTVTVLSFSLAT